MSDAGVVVKGPYIRDMGLEIAMKLGEGQVVEVRGSKDESEVMVTNITREKLEEVLKGMGFEIED